MRAGSLTLGLAKRARIVVIAWRQRPHNANTSSNQNYYILENGQKLAITTYASFIYICFKLDANRVVQDYVLTFQLLLSEGDFKSIMSILSGNLSEGKKASPVGPASTQPQSQSRPSDVPQLRRAEKSVFALQVFENPAQVRTFLRFSFGLDSFSIQLFTGGVHLVSAYSSSTSTVLTVYLQSPSTNPSPVIPLGHFSLEFLSVKAKILSDNSIITSMLLVNCTLDDTRLGREGKLTRLLERQPDAAGEAATPSQSPLSKTMLDVTFQQKRNDMFGIRSVQAVFSSFYGISVSVDARVQSFTLILSVDYLMKLAQFFQTPEEKETTPVDPKVKAIQSDITIESADTQTEGTMTLNLRVEKPQIVLVENMDSIDTEAMILNVSKHLHFLELNIK